MIVPYVGQRRMLEILAHVWNGDLAADMPDLGGLFIQLYFNDRSPRDDDPLDGYGYTFGMTTFQLNNWFFPYTSKDSVDGIMRSKVDHQCVPMPWTLGDPVTGVYGYVVFQLYNFGYPFPKSLVWAQRHPEAPVIPFDLDQDIITVAPQVGMRSP